MSLVAQARIIDLIETFELLQASNPEDERAFDSDAQSDFERNSESDERNSVSDSESDERDSQSDSESDESDSVSDSESDESDSQSDSDSDESDSQSDSESDESDFGIESDNRISPRRVFMYTCIGLLIVIPFLLDAMILLGDLNVMAPSLNLYCVIHTLAAICVFSAPKIFKPLRDRKGKGYTPAGSLFYGPSLCLLREFGLS